MNKPFCDPIHPWSFTSFLFFFSTNLPQRVDTLIVFFPNLYPLLFISLGLYAHYSNCWVKNMLNFFLAKSNGYLFIFLSLFSMISQQHLTRSTTLFLKHSVLLSLVSLSSFTYLYITLDFLHALLIEDRTIFSVSAPGFSFSASPLNTRTPKTLGITWWNVGVILDSSFSTSLASSLNTLSALWYILHLSTIHGHFHSYPNQHHLLECYCHNF